MNIHRGPNDLEEVIERLTKQVEFLKGKCRQSGSLIKNLRKELKDVRQALARVSGSVH
jgi:prefoldin subunit 5|tara:strand:- start:35 stop:208 length:174 start_codon:yes stop_codon:yes gene_type:complete